MLRRKKLVKRDENLGKNVKKTDKCQKKRGKIE